VLVIQKAKTHVISVPKKQAKLEVSGKLSDRAPVQLLSTTQETSAVEAQQESSLDSRFQHHCTEAKLVRPDSSTKRVRLLRDTGALQSLACRSVLTE